MRLAPFFAAAALAAALAGCGPSGPGPAAEAPSTRTAPTVFARATDPARPPRTPAPARTVPVIVPRTPEGGAARPTAAPPDPGAAGLVPATWAEGVPDRAEAATVTGVTDGDTIKVSVGERPETVRLLLIDTPETRHPDRPVECYGPEATAFVRGVLPPGTAIYLEPDVEDRDRYGRALRYVWVEVDGEPYLVNEAIVRNGYAVRSIYPPNVRYADEIGAAQAAARDEGRGLWGACGDWGADAAD